MCWTKRYTSPTLTPPETFEISVNLGDNPAEEVREAVHAEAPVSSEFLSLLRISEFFGFQWQKLAEILSLFKLYNNLGKVAVRVKLWLIIYCGHLVEWIVK